MLYGGGSGGNMVNKTGVRARVVKSEEDRPTHAAKTLGEAKEAG